MPRTPTFPHPLYPLVSPGSEAAVLATRLAPHVPDDPDDREFPAIGPALSEGTPAGRGVVDLCPGWPVFLPRFRISLLLDGIAQAGAQTDQPVVVLRVCGLASITVVNTLSSIPKTRSRATL